MIQRFEHEFHIIYVLELVGVQAQAKNVRLFSADGSGVSVSREDAMSGKAYPAYEWEKQPIPIIHGFPVLAVLPHLAGANWVKRLVKIRSLLGNIATLITKFRTYSFFHSITAT